MLWYYYIASLYFSNGQDYKMRLWGSDVNKLRFITTEVTAMHTL